MFTVIIRLHIFLWKVYYQIKNNIFKEFLSFEFEEFGESKYFLYLTYSRPLCLYCLKKRFDHWLLCFTLQIDLPLLFGQQHPHRTIENIAFDIASFLHFCIKFYVKIIHINFNIHWYFFYLDYWKMSWGQSFPQSKQLIKTINCTLRE